MSQGPSQEPNKRRWLPVLILAVAVFIASFFFLNGPEASHRPPQKTPQMNVDAVLVEAQNFQVPIESYGTVKPKTQSLLVAQVSGQIMSINEQFRDGGFFRKNDTLLQIDDRDYVADVKIAEASLMDARQALQEEKAKAKQAKKDWSRLGNGEEPSTLVLRKPQLLAAEARLVSAQAKLEKARLGLERTHIKAPFDGRIMKRSVDLGQVVQNNAQLGEVYATDAVEIRLPIRNSDLAFITLPESFIGDMPNVSDQPKVRIVSNLASEQSWQGTIVRTESAIDEDARQLHVVAQIDQPFAAKESDAGTKKSAIKIGQYVTAYIEADLLSDAIVIPSAAIYQGSYVFVVENNQLQRKEVTIKWQNGESAVIGQGLTAGDALVTSALGQVTSGMEVTVSLDKAEEPRT